MFIDSTTICVAFSCSLCGRGAVKLGWRGGDVSRGPASGRRCPHPGGSCAQHNPEFMVIR
eukprot:6485296-Amphidinium_carterae.2